MTKEEALITARKGIKITHKYFTPNEWLIVNGNMIQFEDGVQIFWEEWTAGKEYLNEGWSIYKS